MGRSAFELSGDSPKALQVLRRALEGEAFQETIELRNLVFEVDFAPRRDAQGAVLDVIGVATNVTDQRRAEGAANQSEMRYRMLFEGSLAGVYRTTLEGRILDCNDSFAQIFGYSSSKASLARLKEPNAMQNAELSISTLQDLKNLGVSLSMDDFGTGYSSLNYLKRFPIDRIKIDQSFVRDVARDPDDVAIASAIIAMAHSLKLTAVAEGVETEAQLEFLRAQRCDEMQGYLFSAPVPASEFEELLDSSKSLAARRNRVPR